MEETVPPEQFSTPVGDEGPNAPAFFIPILVLGILALLAVFDMHRRKKR